MKRLILTAGFLAIFPLTAIAQQKAQQNAFIDPNTGVLKTVGYVETNAVGDIKVAVPDNFALKPGEWRWNGSSWVAYTPSPDPTATELQDLLFSIDNAVSSPLVPQEIKDVLIKLKKVLGR
jgi:hypothetical protein